MMNHSFGTPASYRIIEKLEENGHEAVFVGGAVRDFLRGETPTDIDIATSAEPTEVKAIFKNTVDLGIQHGTVLVIVQQEPIEVTTYRTEGDYSDARRPDEVKFVKSLGEDLLRRDFTMNAFAMTRTGELIDLFDGKVDMKKELIRAVGNPVARFEEDALRMVRAVRFSSTLGFSIEAATLAAIRANAARIQHVSIERIKIEMDKMFLGLYPIKACNYFQETGLDVRLPLFPKSLNGLAQVVPFTRSIEGWAYLMITGGFMPSAISRAYKLSNDEQRFLTAVHKAYEARIEGGFSTESYYAFEMAVLQTTEKFYHALFPGQPTISNETLAANKCALPIQSRQDLAVNGKDLIEWSGVKSGPWTGEWIGKIEHAVLHGRCENNPVKIKEWFVDDFKSKK